MEGTIGRATNGELLRFRAIQTDIPIVNYASLPRTMTSISCPVFTAIVFVLPRSGLAPRPRS